MRKSILSRSVLSFGIHAMADVDMSAGSNGAGSSAEATPAVPEGFVAVTENYSFRRFIDTPENRREKLPTGEQVDHQIELEIEDQVGEDGKPTGKKIFKRKTETYTFLVPTPASLGLVVEEGNEESVKQQVVFQELITQAVKAVGRRLVDQGITLTPQNCNWDVAVQAEYDRIMSSGTSTGQTFSNELLKEVGELFGNFMRAKGKPEEGIKLMQKMIAARFNRLSTYKYINGLQAIIDNLEAFVVEGMSEEELEQYAPVMQYILERAAKAKEPEEIKTSELF